MPTFTATATTTRTPGRTVTGTRGHQVVTDEPTFLGGPGEAPGAHEYLLMATAGCAATLVGSLARHEGIPLTGVDAEVQGVIDPAQAPRSDVNMFARMTVRLVLEGTDDDTAARLVEVYQQRCPLYGTLVAGLPVDVEWVAKPA